MYPEQITNKPSPGAYSGWHGGDLEATTVGRVGGAGKEPGADREAATAGKES
jgi:hypothetical protein